MLGRVWKSGWIAKCLLVLFPITIFGIYDLYRMLNYFHRFHEVSERRDQWVAEHLIQYTPSSASQFDPVFEQQINDVVSRLRDSLATKGRFASNRPDGYEPIEVGVRYQLDSALLSRKLFTYVDFRLECDCQEAGFFSLLRYRLDPESMNHCDLVADETVEWLKYAPMDRVRGNKSDTEGEGFATNKPPLTNRNAPSR